MEKKRIKVTYPNIKSLGTARITIPKEFAIETSIWGDKEIEVEVVNNEIVIRKCLEGESDALRVYKMFGKSYFLEMRAEANRRRSEKRKQRWREKIAKIRAEKLKQIKGE